MFCTKINSSFNSTFHGLLLEVGYTGVICGSSGLYRSGLCKNSVMFIHQGDQLTTHCLEPVLFLSHVWLLQPNSVAPQMAETDPVPAVFCQARCWRDLKNIMFLFFKQHSCINKSMLFVSTHSEYLICYVKSKIINNKPPSSSENVNREKHPNNLLRSFL